MKNKMFPVTWITSANRELLENVAAGVFDQPICAERLTRYLENPANWLGVAHADGQVIGQVMCVVHDHPDKPTELYLDEIGTADNWRRRGAAQCLMQAVFERADANAIEEIWLGTEPDNLPARALYEKTGATGEAALIFYLEW